MQKLNLFGVYEIASSFTHPKTKEREGEGKKRKKIPKRTQHKAKRN
jgi:hypothetical protein